MGRKEKYKTIKSFEWGVSSDRRNDPLSAGEENRLTIEKALR